MEQRTKLFGLLFFVFFVPCIGFSQVNGVDQMHTVLENLYTEMLPLCSQMIRVAQCIAAFGALFFIGYRIWRHLANAEPIDFFPLLRPFALSIAIGLFPQVIGIINGLFNPVVSVTGSLVKNSHEDVDRLLHQRDVLSNATGVGGPFPASGLDNFSNYDRGGSGWWYNLFHLNLVQLLKMLLAVILEIAYYAASLCIDCMRTFHLVILAILGPLVFALAVYDGFQHTLSIWIGRYINIYLWLPIANLFGAMIARIQVAMLKTDIAALQSGQDAGFSQTDIAYLVFLVIGIIGYFSIPSIANYVVHASGGSAIMSKTNTLISSQLSTISRSLSKSSNSSGSGSGSSGSMSSNVPGDDRLTSSMADAGNSNAYQQNKISGKSSGNSKSGSDYNENKVFGE